MKVSGQWEVLGRGVGELLSIFPPHVLIQSLERRVGTERWMVKSCHTQRSRTCSDNGCFNTHLIGVGGLKGHKEATWGPCSLGMGFTAQREKFEAIPCQENIMCRLNALWSRQVVGFTGFLLFKPFSLQFWKPNPTERELWELDGEHGIEKVGLMCPWFVF